MGMMKRIKEQRLVATIPAALRRWLRENPESRHLVDPAPMIKGEGRRIETIDQVKEAILHGSPIKVIKMRQGILFH